MIFIRTLHQNIEDMKNNKLFPLLLTAPLLSCTKSEQRPNIILFLLDDFGWLDSSVAYGEEVYPNNLRYDTPNMARLAEKGVIMTNAYACPVSSPTRTSIMTGMHPAQCGLTMFCSNNYDVPTDATGGMRGTFRANDNVDDPFIRPDWNWNGISPVAGTPRTVTVTPMVQLLKDAGYYTILAGKAHFSTMGTPAASPYNLGFLVNLTGHYGGMPSSYQGQDHYGNKPGEWKYHAVPGLFDYWGSETHLTEALTVSALKTLDYPIDNNIPFYFNFAHYATHTPIQPDSRYYDKYIARGMDHLQACYGSMVEGVDKSLGDLLDYLDAKGVADNTIIIFYSDNGGHSVNTSKGGQPHCYNLPLREGKGSVYEGGVRVPMIAYIPNKSAAGTRINTPVNPQDLFPTILEFAGVKNYSTIQQVTGQSLVKLLTDGSQYVAEAMERGEIADQRQANAFVVPQRVSDINPTRPIITHFPHQWRIEDQYDVDFLSAIRRGEWKLVYRMHDYALELYNLKEDLGERNNVASAHPDIVRQLSSELSDTLRRWNAPMPTVRATKQRVPMPDEL